MLTKTDLTQITKIVQSENKSLETKMNKRFNKLEEKLDYAINFMDRDYLKLLHRVERIEEHLNLEVASV
jgi:hypothetical protein